MNTQFDDEKTEPDLMLHVSKREPLTAEDVRQLSRAVLPLYLSDEQVRSVAPEVLSALEVQCLTVAEQRVRILEVLAA